MARVKKDPMKTMVESMNKARTERMTIKAGSNISKNFIVIHDKTAYNVFTDGEKIFGCDCPHHVYRHAVCKHMMKVSIKKKMDIDFSKIEEAIAEDEAKKAAKAAEAEAKVNEN